MKNIQSLHIAILKWYNRSISRLGYLKHWMHFFAILILLITQTQCAKVCKNEYNDNYKGHYKVGQPYKIKGQWHFPKEDPHYDEVGYASWYGDKFHCKKTANSEFFNKHQLSAAHRTLPLPSIVEVTNLSNGRTIDVLINDRGPYIDDRIIDLSEKAAHALGMKHQGIAKVRVKFKKQHTEQLLAQLQIKKSLSQKNPQKNIQLAQQIDNLTERMKKVNKSNVSNSDKSSKNIFINVGLFNTKKDALNSIKNLSNIGFPTLNKKINKGKVKYEVYFSSAAANKQAANNMLKKIIDLGYNKARIVKIGN